MIKGIKSIYEEAYNTCKKNNEKSKYLMVFQKLMSAVPKWNEILVKKETA
jgi:hypothetical protein